MTDGYDCYQNALAERINGILKNEFLLSRPADLGQAWEIVKESVAIYNHERPHLALKSSRRRDNSRRPLTPPYMRLRIRRFMLTLELPLLFQQ